MPLLKTMTEQLIESVRRISKVFIILSAVAFTAQGEPYAPPSWEKARSAYYAGLQSEKANTDAIILFDRFSAETEDNAPALVYLGSLIAVKAKFVGAPHTKLQYAKQGLALIDRALAEDPNNPEMLFIAGTTFYYLPFFFGRRSQADHCLRRILYLGPDRMGDMPPHLVRNAVQFILQHIELSDEERAGALQWLAKLEQR